MSKGSPAPGGYGLFSFGSPLGTNPVAFRSNNTPPSFSISAWSPDINRASSPIGIDALSPQADDIVTLHRGNINSPIGVEQPSISSSPTARNSDSPPAHIINIFSPSGKSEALFKALGVSPTLGYSDGLLSEDEEDDDELNSFQLPPSALSEYDEFIEGMGGMDDLDSSEPSSYHHQHYTPGQPTGFETNGMLFNHASPNIGGTSPASSRLVSKSPLSCHVLSNSPVPAPLPNGDSPPNQYGEHPVGEHPSRTLFVRNINSNVEESDLRTMFETFGPLRSMYTQCKHRGFVMISYFDIRHAKNAMKNLQGKVLRRRKLDIHYSIPKDNPSEKDQNQGTLVVFNLDPSITSEELRVIFGNHGEIKEIRETPNKKHHKFIEFYDVRDAERAMKNLNKTEIKSKKIKIEPSRPGGRKSTYSPRSGDEASGMFMSGNGSSYESSGNFGYYEDDKSLSKSAPSQNHLEHLNSSSNVIHTSFSNTFSFLEHAPAELSSSGESFLFSPLSPTSNTSPSMIGSGLNNSSNNAIKDPRDQFAAPRRRPKAVSVMSPTLGSSPHSSGLTSSANNVANMVSSSVMNNSSINGGTGVAPRSPNWSSPSNSPVTSSHHRPLRSLSLPVSHQSPGGEEVGASVNISHSGGNINSSSTISSSQASTHHNGNNNNNTSSSNNSNNNNSMFSLSAFHSPPHGERDDASDSSLNDSELPSPRERKHRSKENDRSQFVLDIERVRNHIDVRTTLMIKNIPNKYTQKMLLTTVDDTQKGQYDFFYLPIDFKNKCNVGYAFINFIDPLSIISFYEKLHNTKWEKFNSEKVCDIAYARIQGKDSLINHFQNSSLMCEDKKCRPIIFHSNGPNIGQQAPFPVGPNVRMRSKDEKVFPARTEVRRHKDDSGNGVRPSGVKKNGKNARSRSYSYNK